MNHPHFLCGPTAFENLAFRSHSRFAFQQGLWWDWMEHAFLMSHGRARQQSSLFLSLECLTHVCIQVPSASDFVYKPHGTTAYTPTVPSSYLSLSELGKLHSIELFTGFLLFLALSFTRRETTCFTFSLVLPLSLSHLNNQCSSLHHSVTDSPITF